jgi:Na+-translocating ferredoxin:NAD+ oxidoreductase RnfG subunit
MLWRVAIVLAVLAAVSATAVGYVKSIENDAYDRGAADASRQIQESLANDAMVKKKAADEAERNLPPVPTDKKALKALCESDAHCREHGP